MATAEIRLAVKPIKVDEFSMSKTKSTLTLSSLSGIQNSTKSGDKIRLLNFTELPHSLAVERLRLHLYLLLTATSAYLDNIFIPPSLSESVSASNLPLSLRDKWINLPKANNFVRRCFIVRLAIALIKPNAIKLSLTSNSFLIIQRQN